MLNKIMFLAKGELITKYHIIYDNVEANTNDTLVVTDNEVALKEYSTKDFAVLFVSDSDEFVEGAKYIIDDLKSCDDEYLEIVFSRCKGLPVKVFETKRTFVREMTLDDLLELYELYDDEEIRKYVDALYEYEEEKEFTKKYIENMYGFYGYGLWLVFDSANGALIGRIGISIRNLDGEEVRELGYVIKKEYRRKGYAIEVCKAAMEYAFEFPEIDKIYIVTHSENMASIGVANKLGFEYIGESVGEKENFKIFVKST